VFLRSVLQLLVTDAPVPSSPILVTLVMEVTRSSETSVLTRVTQRHIPQNGILLIQFGRLFQGRLRLRKRCFASDDELCTQRSSLVHHEMISLHMSTE
jgi:hypothetical protein